MVSTVVEVCNLALRRVDAAKTITGFGEGTLESSISEQFYQPTLEEVLADHPWKFAAKTASLAQTTALPGWIYAFTKPNDFVRIISAADNKYFRGSGVFDYQREDEFFLSDSSEFWLRYVQNAPAINNWPPRFLGGVVLKIAAKMVGPLKRSRAQADELEQKAEDELSKAKHTNDAVEGPAEPMPESSWVTARDE